MARLPSQSLCSSRRPLTTTFGRASVVVRMAKGRKTDKKRKAAPPAGNKDDDGGKSPQEALTSSNADGEPESFGILGSAGDSPRGSKPTGFGASPSPMNVDAAYEKALNKIKGQDRLSGPVLGAGGGGPGGSGPPVRADGKVPVRNIGVLDVIPESVQSGFELTLIALLAINLLVIIVIGIGFAVEALPTSNLDLPESVQALSKQVQPFIDKTDALFTPSLGTFFLISIVLGAFKLSQLSTGGTTYVEKSVVEKGLRQQPNRYNRRKGGNDGPL